MQANVSESATTDRLDMIEHHMQLISTQIGLAGVTFISKQPLVQARPDLPDQAGTAQPGCVTSPSLTQQLRDMRAELSHLQQAHLSAQTRTPSVASTELAELRGHLEEHSTQVQQLHQAVAACKQDINVLQNSTAAQERAAAEMQQGHQDLVLQMSNVSADLERHGSTLQDAVSHREERHAKLIEQLCQHHTDLENLSSSSKLHDEQLKQHSAALAQHEQQLLDSESLGAETQLASKSLQERVGSVAASASVTGMSWAVLGCIYKLQVHVFPPFEVYQLSVHYCVGML